MKFTVAFVALASIYLCVEARPVSLLAERTPAQVNSTSVASSKSNEKAGGNRIKNMSNSTDVKSLKNNNGFQGAAFFMTNQPEGNFIVTAGIGSDGKLSLQEAVATEGAGLHGDDGSAGVGPDGTFSQGAVKASQAGQFVAAVNPGSNTVSMFAIDNNNPAKIKHMGFPVSSGGEFPMALTVNKAGDKMCVANGGAVNGVQCYKVDKKTGAVAIANSNRSLGLKQTTPPAGPAGTVSHVIFTEDEKNLVASVKGVPPTPGFLAVWDVASDGSLSKDFKKVDPGKGGLLPFSMTNIPGSNNAVLATDAGVGFDIFDLSDVSKNANSSKNSVVPIKGQGATCWSSFSKKTGNFYLTDILTSEVTEVNVDKNLKGSIVKQYQQTKNSSTIDNDIASIGNNDFMYVLQPSTSSISVLALNAPGKATNLQTVDFGKAAENAKLKIDKNNLQGMTTFVKGSK